MPARALGPAGATAAPDPLRSPVVRIFSIAGMASYMIFVDHLGISSNADQACSCHSSTYTAGQKRSSSFALVLAQVGQILR